jgi:hypothetical protein
VNALVLDAGALIAIDRDDRDVHKTVRDAHRMGVQVLTNSMAVAQVWRDSKGRQAELAKVLRGVRVQPVTSDDGRKAGELLEAAGLSDAIDASVALWPRPATGCSPAIRATSARCAKRPGTGSWWFAADAGIGGNAVAPTLVGAPGLRRAHARLRKVASPVMAYVRCDSAKVAVIRAAGNRVRVVRC